MFGVFKRTRASSNTDDLGQRYGQYPYGPPLPEEDHPGAEGLTFTARWPGLGHAALPISMLSQVGVPTYLPHRPIRRDLNLSGDLYYNEPVAEWAFMLVNAPRSRTKQGVPLERMLVQVTSSVSPGINHITGR